MLFAAGMGIGLLFFGVSEPMSHFSSSLGGTAMGEDGVRTDWAPAGAAGGDAAAAQRLGMAATIFHWGLHPWAIYAVVALALALFSYNKGLPLTLRSAFYPLLGDRVWGWTGHIIDTLAVFATLFGLATSLGFGAEQTASGLTFLFGSRVTRRGHARLHGHHLRQCEDSGVENNPLLLVILISAITAVALVSVVRGLDGGVKVLSEINMGLAAILLLFVFFVGGPIFLITLFFDSIWAYFQNIWALSNPVGREDVNFSQGWTSFYWAWWISWSPFVGMFIARVSRGRTVREFIICVLIIPTTVCILWMTVFGGTALNQVVADGYTGAQDAALELKLFKMLAELPLATITSVIGIILVIVFFVTSSDSGSARDRHDHRGRQGRRAGVAACVLVHLRRRGRDRTADRRWPCGAAIGGDLDRSAVHAGAAGDVLRDLEGACLREALSTAPPGRMTRPPGCCTPGGFAVWWPKTRPGGHGW